jgi:hypothetical protein
MLLKDLPYFFQFLKGKIIAAHIVKKALQTIHKTLD